MIIAQEAHGGCLFVHYISVMILQERFELNLLDSILILDGIMLIRHISFDSDSIGYLTVYKCEIQVQKLTDLSTSQRF